MDEIGHYDKVNKIISYKGVLLIHLIKQGVEKRSTRAWEDSIEESLTVLRRRTNAAAPAATNQWC